jgi:hypothetical protein
LTAVAPFFSAWTGYTPTLGGFTLGNGSISGAYLKIGRMVMVRAKFILGSTSGKDNFLTISIPFAAANQSELVSGSALFVDGGTRYLGTVVGGTNSSNVEVLPINAAGTYAQTAPVQATVPFTWGTGDEVFLRITYEATS